MNKLYLILCMGRTAAKNRLFVVSGHSDHDARKQVECYIASLNWNVTQPMFLCQTKDSVFKEIIT